MRGSLRWGKPWRKPPNSADEEFAGEFAPPADRSAIRSRIERNRALRFRALFFAGQFDGDAQQQLAIALFHLPKQATDSVEEATPFAREAPFFGRGIFFPD